jgi:hypothetical protein
MDTNEIGAYFYTAQDARRALNALQAINAKVLGPQPIEQPVNGRTWMLQIEPAGGYSGFYTDPARIDQVVGIILKWNGITNAAHPDL